MATKVSDDFRSLVNYDLTWRDDARRFEVLTLPFQDFAGFNASLELLLEAEPAAVADATARLADPSVYGDPRAVRDLIDRHNDSRDRADRLGAELEALTATVGS